MAEFALLTDGFLQIINLSQIEKGLEEGRTVQPAFVERKRGEIVDLTDSDAARLLSAGAIEKPGEGARARLEFARAQADRAQAELAAVEAQQPAEPELEAAAEEAGAARGPAGDEQALQRAEEDSRELREKLARAEEEAETRAEEDAEATAAAEQRVAELERAVENLQQSARQANKPADEPSDVKDGFAPWRTAKKPELEAAAKERGLDVQGTGADGNVTVEDLRAALEPTDQR